MLMRHNFLAFSCSALSLFGVGAFAASPTLPQVLMDTTYRTPSGSTTAVNSGGNLQTAIDNASCGDILSLEAGATFTGNFTLPDKDCAAGNYVVIRTSTPDGIFPRPGTRVGPSHASLMAKIASGTTDIIASDSDADHYRFIGIEVAATANITTLISLAGGQGNLSTQTNHIIFDRCYIHGDATNGSRRGISAQGAYIALIDSYVSDIKQVGSDTQAFAAWNASGPFKLVNNYLEASGENVMFGGSLTSGAGFIPSDIEIRRNHFKKPTSWCAHCGDYGGTTWTVKNLFEIKYAKRVLIEDNLFEQVWPQSQSGYAILFTVNNDEGSTGEVTIQDVTFRGNWIRKAGNGATILGVAGTPPSTKMARVDMRHNLWTDIGVGDWCNEVCDQRHTIILNSPTDLVMNFNTSIGPAGTTIYFVPGAEPQCTGLVSDYNVGQLGGNGIFTDSDGTGTAALNTACTGYEVTGNAWYDAIGVTPANYPSGNNYESAWSGLGFENYAGGDYRLAATSSYYGVASGGADTGAWIPASTSAASQLDWSVEVRNGYTGVAVTFGVPGLPQNQSCDVRVGSSKTTSSSGPSRRTVVVTGLTPASSYFIGVDCGTTWGGWLSWENYTATATPVTTKTVPFTMRPPATLATVARVKVECSATSDMADPVSAQDTSCTSAAVCEVNVASVPSGVNYCRHIYQTSGDVAVVTSGVQVVSVD